jgi:lysyl-tRNA synthetase class 2
MTVREEDWRPTASAAALRARARLLSLLRQFFNAREFIEVETNLLSRDVVVDRHLDPFYVTLYSDPTAPDVGDVYFTQTSPEFGMKRLLATRELPAIYQICKAFRAGERGDLHNPEFTMLEWYRIGDDYQKGMDLLAELAAEIWSHWKRGQITVDRISYQELFETATGLNPHIAPTHQLVAWAKSQALPPPRLFAEDRDSWIDWISSQFAESRLDPRTPTIVYDFPASRAALAQVSDQNGIPVARRFELYCAGLEVANGYYELLDPEVLARRTEIANKGRANDRKRPLPKVSRLIDAMRHGLPPCAGTALGVDRLLMALSGAQKIDEVVAFPVDRA